jgi:hypothetical protein
MKKNLLASLLTFVILLVVTGLGYIFYIFPSESLSVIVGIICLIFIRHIFFVIRYMLADNI